MGTFTWSLQQCLQLCHHVGRTARRALEVALRRETAGLEHCMNLRVDLHSNKLSSDAEAPEVTRGRAGKILKK